MRIGYLIPEFPGQTHAFFWREMTALEEMGTDVTLISTRAAPSGSCPHDFAAPGIARCIYLFPPSPAAMLRVATPGLPRALAYLAQLDEGGLASRAKVAALLPSARMLADLARRERLDYIHIHSAANAAHLGALARCFGGAPYGVTLHGDLPVYGTNHRAKFGQAALVTAVTEPLRQQIAAILPGRDVPVIPMGVDTARFAPPATRRRAGPLRIVSVARLNYVKGHRHILDAMATLARRDIETEATFIGDGPYRAEIETEIERHGFEDIVRLTGAVPEDAVREALHAADVFVLASFGQGEAAPVAVMEAMATGTPVIASRIGGTGDMIADGVDGFLVPQEDVGAIADRLALLSGDPALYARMADAARQTALARFDFRARAAQLKDAIAAAIA